MDVVLWGNARRWSYHTFSTATEPVDVHERRPSTAQWQTSVDESHGVGMGREERLYHCLAAVESSLRSEGCPPLNPNARKELFEMGLRYGRVGWEAAMRALHKLNKRAYDYSAREGPMQRPSNFLMNNLNDCWHEVVDTSLAEEEQLADTTNNNDIKRCLISTRLGTLKLCLGMIESICNKRILRTGTSSPCVSGTSVTPSSWTMRPSSRSWSSRSGRARASSDRE